MRKEENNFTYKELRLLADGILTMMENTNKAMVLTKNLKVQEMLSQDLDVFCALTDKVCRMMGEVPEDGGEADA